MKKKRFNSIEKEEVRVVMNGSGEGKEWMGLRKERRRRMIPKSRKSAIVTE